MLRIRFITSIVIAPLIIGAIYYLPSYFFQLLLLLITLLASFEWSRLSQFNRPIWFVLLLFLALMLASSVVKIDLVATAIVLMALFWLANFVFIIFYPQSKFIWQQVWIKVVSGLLLLVPFFTLSVILQSVVPTQLILLVLLVSSADIGAYFAGKAFGKHKLVPKISPNKTTEGAIGGILLALMVLITWTFFIGTAWQFWQYLLLFATIVATIVGDLYISTYKRYADLKNSGNILPGHGGILDRIDSYTAAVPVFALMILI